MNVQTFETLINSIPVSKKPKRLVFPISEKSMGNYLVANRLQRQGKINVQLTKKSMIITKC